MGFIFEVVEGGFLDIDVMVNDKVMGIQGFYVDQSVGSFNLFFIKLK